MRLALLLCLTLPALPTSAQSLYATGEWDAAVDAAWGDGLPTDDKLALFDDAMAGLEAGFAAFHGRDLNVDSLAARYRPLLEAGVSRGRFNAIMNRIALLAQEGHTFIGDAGVSFTPPAPDVPIFYVDAWSDVSHFGAGLTPLPDETLLVYKVVENHPLGLEPGDIILGYHGIPWARLVDEIWALELPIYFSFTTGTSDEARRHMMLSAAGMNWHLFDTIDVRKRSLNYEIASLPVTPLAELTAPLWGNEQLPVPGVEFPEFVQPIFQETDNRVTWGFLDDTDIAYVYVNGWSGTAGAEFLATIDTLMFHVPHSGMIVDFRLNYGGSITASHPALELLFDETFPTIGWDRRCGDPDDHFEMCPDGNRPTENYIVNGDPNTYYDKPIAILTGPGTFSAGDQNAYKLALHPEARVFGKPTSGGFTGVSFPSLGNPEWIFALTSSSSYRVEDPDTYLARWGNPVDEPLWLTPDDVAEGRDTVAEAARAWIEKQATDAEASGAAQPQTSLGAAYPNPISAERGTTATTIPYRTTETGTVRVAIYDVTGRHVRTLIDGVAAAGAHKVVWNGRDGSGRAVSAGVYLVRLSVDGEPRHTRRLTLLR